tara:strand:+ start:1204 stop:1959 length:756 start_codon:yes stop_codon:yes gene_type:complete
MDLKTRYIIMKAELSVWFALEINTIKADCKDFKSTLQTIKRSLTFSFRKLILLLSLTLSILFYFLATLTDPVVVDKHTMTNGERTIVFQEMIHIGEEQFYTKIISETKAYKKNGFQFFYELLLRGNNEEATKSFIKYSKLNEVCKSITLRKANNIITQGKSYSDNIEILNGARRVDLTFDDLYNSTRNATEPDCDSKAVLNTRDLNLANNLLISPEKKIYVHYGKLHWNNVGRILKDNGFREVITTEYKVF